ncbi:peptidoglycan endopeptidase [Deefgea chitinilytica]|uniref:Peptidoglycan endopeptidase n=2 Tax=Chitinibacteraceae TaxID=2897177 RepID=A0ABS2C860_9NEIS|nr:peptidoglycan endopeptidase [Deefgea chitinilytica]
MPIGDTSPSAWLGSGDAAAPTTAKTRAKKTAARPTDKTTDYTPAQDLLLSAMSLIGVKYTWGGNTPESGLDCSGFIRYVFQNSMNMTLPRTAVEMAQTGKTIDKTELKPGDLVFFNTLGRTFSHVGIYLGDNRFIHSPRAGRSVEVANMGQSYWTSRFTGARRIADSGAEGLNVNAMLANSSNEARRVSTSSRVVNTATASSRTECKKVITGKGKNKKTAMKCAQVKINNADTNAKPAKASRGAKATTSSARKTAAKAPAKKSVSQAPKTPNKPNTKSKTPAKNTAKK